MDALPKKIQYVVIDSDYVTGTNNTFSVNFDLGSNLFVESIRDVVGVKVVDFFVTQIGSSDAGNINAAKYLDIICPDIPTAAQLLDERKSRILTRIPLERNFSGSTSLIVHDKQWKAFNRQTNYFNPISIKKLNFEIYEYQGDGDYRLLQPDASFYMVLEISTIDREAQRSNIPPSKQEILLEKLYEKVDAYINGLGKDSKEDTTDKSGQPNEDIWNSRGC